MPLLCCICISFGLQQFPCLPFYTFLFCICFPSSLPYTLTVAFLIFQVFAPLHACLPSLPIVCPPSSACILPLWYTFPISQSSASSLLIILNLLFLLLLCLSWAHFPSLMQLFSSLPVLTWKLSHLCTFLFCDILVIFHKYIPNKNII